MHRFYGFNFFHCVFDTNASNLAESIHIFRCSNGNVVIPKATRGTTSRMISENHGTVEQPEQGLPQYSQFLQPPQGSYSRRQVWMLRMCMDGVLDGCTLAASTPVPLAPRPLNTDTLDAFTHPGASTKMEKVR